jgi:hypothetical protein
MPVPTHELIAQSTKLLRIARRNIGHTKKSVDQMVLILGRARRQDYLHGREPYVEPLQ